MKTLLTFLPCFLITLSSFAQVEYVYEGLVAYYPFNGNADDASEYDHHGDIHGATLTFNRFGAANQAYEFDGIDDFISVAHSEAFNFDAEDTYSVSMWFRAESEQLDQQTNGNDLLSKWFIDGNETTQDGYTIAIRYNNQNADDPFVIRTLRFDGYSGGNCQNVQVINAPTTFREWHHVVTTFDAAGNYKLYVDNQLVETLSNVLVCSPKNSSPLLMAKRGAVPHPQHFRGALDDIRIYDRALTVAEVDTLYSYTPTTKIKEVILESFTIYPNPHADYFQIDGNIPTDGLYRLVDLEGKIVLEEPISTKIMTTALANGVYVLQIFDKNRTLIGVEKIIKLKPLNRP